MSFEFVNYKKDFPLLANSDVAYLDSAATAQRPTAVLDAERDFYERANANPLRGLYALGMEATDRYEAARERVRRFLNAASDAEIIFTRNTTESINLVAYSYALNHLRPGDEIVVSILEHHSNLLPWQMAARMTGATLVYLDCEPDGSLPEQTLRSAIGPRTKIAAIGQVSNVLGCVNPVEQVIDLVHRNGGVVLVDAAQSVPHMKIDVQALGADFIAMPGHKGLYGPQGTGLLLCNHEVLPLLYGGTGSLSKLQTMPDMLPDRLESGTHNMPGIAGLLEGIRYVQRTGVEKIAAHERRLTAQAVELLRNTEGIRLFWCDGFRHQTGVLSFIVEGIDCEEMGEAMASRGIALRAGLHCAPLAHRTVGTLKTGTIRFSPSAFNTPAQVMQFAQILQSTLRKM